MITQVATCPLGKVVVSGGFNYMPSATSVAASYPITEGTGWSVSILRTNNSGSTTFTVWALCANPA